MLQAKTKEQKELVRRIIVDECPCGNSVLNVYEESFEADIASLSFETMAKIVDYLRSVNKPKKSERFVKPTIEEIQAHIFEKGYTFDAEAFYAFYESNGWKVGKNPMKNWKMACTTWAKNRRNNNNNGYGRETITDKIRRSVEESSIFSQQLAERIGSQQQADVCDGDNDEVW